MRHARTVAVPRQARRLAARSRPPPAARAAIPRQASVEAQYRFAQSKVTEDQREAFFDLMRRVLMQRFSIPWRKEYDAVPHCFKVDDPRRVIRLVVDPGAKMVTLLNATDPAFAAALEAVAAKW